MAKRILLADDSITIQKVVELTFSDGDYEVTAVNNGAKAIQKLSEMRPDIILSDIIMPEKNGYEVCEYVKSHPEFRTIPVILLTGTFEPFDPDRADKAGCDAVVTKPFESQSLIHKVEELIDAARSQSPTAPASPSSNSFASDSPFAEPSAPSPSGGFATGTFHPQGEIFGGPSPTTGASSTPTTEMPFEAPAETSGETRAFPKMNFDDLKSSEPATPGGETRAFPKMSFDDLRAASEPPPPPPPASSPWDEQAPAGETRAFPRMSFDDMQRAASEPPPPSPAPPEESTAKREAFTPFGGPTAPPPSPVAESLPWDDGGGAFAGETRAMPKVSFDELEKMASEAPPMPDLPEPPAWSPPPLPPDEPEWMAPPEPPRFAMGPGDDEPAAKSETTPPPATSAAASTGTQGELTDEQVDRIARRVVQLMSETVVRNIAWEVIPDLAEIVVKERIRQLESE